MSENQHIFLSTFKPSDLIFDEEETKEILKFFFQNDQEFIDGLVITDRLRSLAQGLLVEAVDASYAIGFVKIIYETFFLKPPQPKIKKILAKLSKKALMHWFKHAKATDLTTIKIYDCVRKTIAIKFRQYFINIANDLVMNKPAVAVIAYSLDILNRTIWG